MEIFIRIKVHRLHIYVVVLLALAHFSLRVDSLVAALVLSTGILKRLKRSWCSFGWEARCRDALAEFVGDTLDLKPKSQLSPALLGPAKRTERLLSSPCMTLLAVALPSVYSSCIFTTPTSGKSGKGSHFYFSDAWNATALQKEASSPKYNSTSFERSEIWNSDFNDISVKTKNWQLNSSWNVLTTGQSRLSRVPQSSCNLISMSASGTHPHHPSYWNVLLSQTLKEG